MLMYWKNSPTLQEFKNIYLWKGQMMFTAKETKRFSQKIILLFYTSWYINKSLA